MKLSDLKPAEYNPRVITETAFEGLKYSLSEFGDISGITFNKRTGNLVSGHQRVKAIINAYGDLEIKNDAIITPAGEFKLRIVDWPIEKEKAANITANSPTLQGKFTSDLAFLLEELKIEMPSLVEDLMLEEIQFPDVKLTAKEDEFNLEDELQKIKAPKTKNGDLFILGKHKLLCGDSTKIKDVEKLMGREKARLIFTDPPYNVDYRSPSGLDYSSKKFGGTGGKIFNDKKSDKEALEFYTEVLKRLYDHSTDDATLYWWFANKNHEINRQALRKAKWHFSQVIIWVKNSFVFSRGQDYHRMYEPCMVGWKKGKKHFRNNEYSNLADVFNLDKISFNEIFDIWYEHRDNTLKYLHPTQKPVRLAERAIKRNSRQADIVVDFFGGSGSTLIACEQLNRKNYVIELDPKFCDVIVIRYLKFTKSRHVILNGKKTEWNYATN